MRWLTDLPNAQVVADRFTESNPDVKIEVETVTFREVFQQNQVRLGAKSDDLDIVSVDAPVVAGYGLRGWLLPLDEAFTPEETSAWVRSPQRLRPLQRQPARPSHLELLPAALLQPRPAGGRRRDPARRRRTLDLGPTRHRRPGIDPR